MPRPKGDAAIKLKKGKAKAKAAPAVHIEYEAESDAENEDDHVAGSHEGATSDKDPAPDDDRQPPTNGAANGDTSRIVSPQDVKVSDPTVGSVSALSDIGLAGYKALKLRHAFFEKVAWNVTKGSVVQFLPSPPVKFFKETTITSDGKDPQGKDVFHHSDYLPQRMCDVIKTAEKWVDITTLNEPTGLFMEKLAEA